MIRDIKGEVFEMARRLVGNYFQNLLDYMPHGLPPVFLFRGVKSSALGLHGMQGGYECGPTQNRVFT